MLLLLLFLTIKTELSFEVINAIYTLYLFVFFSMRCIAATLTEDNPAFVIYFISNGIVIITALRIAIHQWNFVLIKLVFVRFTRRRKEKKTEIYLFFHVK